MTGESKSRSFNSQHGLRVAVLQRVVPSYRVALFRHLASLPGIQLKVFFGEDIPESKVRSATEVAGFEFARCRTRFFRLGKRTLVWHHFAFRGLHEFKPDVVISEGESNVLTFCKALVYRALFRRTRLIHWSLGGLPGSPMRYGGFRGFGLRMLRAGADAFLVYSSYGKKVLESNGVEANRIHVATNVADVSHHLALAQSTTVNEARSTLDLQEEFVILFVGAFAKNKRLDVLVDAVSSLSGISVRCFLVGDGPVRKQLERQADAASNEKFTFAGRISEGIAMYFRAADVFVLPGRGGMVISEAMAYSLPVVAYQADGTEFDLIEDGVSGVILRHGDAPDLKKVLVRLASDRDSLRVMGTAARERVAGKFGTSQMVRSIETAIRDVTRGS